MSTNMSTPTHLVIVCGHAIWIGGPNKGRDEAEWLIENYKAGETPTFIEHIKAGIEVVAKDPRAVLMFSGGATKQDTVLSEARSYANLAAVNSYFGCLTPESPESEPSSDTDWLSPLPLHSRVKLEERALDSYYNILFSIVEFWRIYQAWPERLTIVSHAFKRARLVDAHCGAIGFPLDRVSFVGINPPNLPADLAEAGESPTEGSTSVEKEKAMQGARLIVGQWEEDPHGMGSVLAGKRKERNIWGTNQMLFKDDDERERSGLKTVIYDGMEALAEDSPRPWAT